VKSNKEHSKESSKDKDRNRVELKAEIKREKELPLVNGKPYSSTFKQLMKKDINKSTSHHEKRPMEKYANRNLYGEKKSSKDKRPKAIDPVDVMKQMKEASKIGEKASGPSFKIPKKSDSLSVLGETEDLIGVQSKRNGSYQRIKVEPSTPERGLSSSSSPSTSDESSSDEEMIQRLSSSPDMYKDRSPIPLPNSPPASPDNIYSENDMSEDEEYIGNLSEDIQPLINGFDSHDQKTDENSSFLMSTIADFDSSTEKFFCQLCDLFDKDGGKKSLVLLHILQSHLKGFSDEFEACTSIQQKMDLFCNEENYSRQFDECNLQSNLYQPALILTDNITRWKCLRCPNVSTMYKIEQEAERHVALEHYGDMLVPRKWFSKDCEVFECSQFGCERKFTSWICLTNHEILLHDAFKGYLGTIFKNDYLLKTNIPKKRLRD